MEVNWQKEFDGRDKRFERFVACLLSTEHGPKMKRLDGSGGDGGRDCYLFRPDGKSADYFQVKCVFGRLNGKGRKPAIRESFKKAMANPIRPTSWTLVVPGTLTSTEEAWLFKNCQAEGVDVDWRGEPWLDHMVGTHVNIRNHWFTDERDLALKILAEKNFADAVGGPTIDAVARTAATEIDRLNEADAYFSYAIGGSDLGMLLNVTERYPGAASDASTSLHVTVRDREAAAAIDKHAKFGTGFMLDGDEALVEIRGDSPIAGKYVLGGAGDIEFSIDPHRYMKLRLANPVADAAAQITLNHQRGTVGDHGRQLTLADRRGFLVMRIEFPHEGSAKDASIHTSVHYPVGSSARELLPMVRFIQAANAGESIIVETPESVDGGEPASMEIPGDEADNFFRLIEDWAQIELACDIDIPFPAGGVTEAQADDVHEVAMLLRGESRIVAYDRIRVPFSDPARATEVAEGSSAVGSPARWTFIQDEQARVLGVTLPVRRAIYLADAVIENLDEMLAGDTDAMLLVPATEDSVAVVLPHTALGAVGLHLDDDGKQIAAR